ncbi:SDR family NAD(P)-dependent oxidoreductase [Bacteroidetes/Chlorobi group bacterium ChocPot_Mid]|nr:MAG: SDR family NAD(P)-dependent oxidoreductase [Bacteroidetes/Chlorobi group bacterium ChocPot_Mid]
MMMTKNIIITGASRGIGREMALELGKQGHNLLLLARDEDKLKSVCDELKDSNISVHYLKCDVTEKSEVNDAIEYAKRLMGTIDIAILNSGVAGSGYFKDFQSDKLRNIFDVNVFGIAYFMEGLIPIMKEQGYGTIAGVSSLADLRGIPGNAAYCASKSSVTFLLDAARVELAEYGISVITIKPGFVKSDMTANNAFFMPFLMESEEAAKIIVNGIMSGKKRIAFPLPMVFLSWLGKIVPSTLFEYLIGLYGKPINQ